MSGLPINRIVLSQHTFPGSRVTDEILRLVPNVAVFRDALRCIKLWAQSTSQPCLLSVFINHLYLRTSDLFECECFPRRCCVGHACRASMPTVSKRCGWLDSQPLLHHHHVPMVGFSYIKLSWCCLPTLLSARSWPQPVLLKQIEEGPLNVRVWNPRVGGIIYNALRV